MNRRSFLASMLAASAAPYVVTTAGVLMPARHVVAPPRYGSPCTAIRRFDNIPLEPGADVTYDDNADGGFIINGAGMYAISAVTLERTGELYLANTAIMLRPGDVLRPSKNLSFNITRLA